MKKTLYLSLVLCMGLAGPAIGASCTPYTIPDDGDDPCDHLYPDDCSSEGTKQCYMRSDGSCSCITSCNRCNSGFAKVSKTLEGCSGITYNTCECTCSNCTSDTSWSAGSTGYQKQTTRWCECYAGTPTCNTSTEYRCAVGYYGSSTNGSSGCARCPASSGTYGTTASAGTTSVSGCYIPAGSSFSDSTGSGTYTRDCAY